MTRHGIWGLMMTTQIMGAEPTDPHLWLEDVSGAKAMTWVKEQDAKTLATLANTPAFATLNQRFLAMLDSKEKIPSIDKIGSHYYNFWRDAEHPRGVWRRTTLEEYRKTDPKWETVLDLDALGKAENENWVWHGAKTLAPEHRQAMLSLSRGGADANVIREFDLTTKSFVADGFALPEAKGSVDWIDANTLFVQTNFGAGSLTKSGYPRIVKRWRRGQPIDQAETVYEGQETDVAVSAYHDDTKGFERDFVHRSIMFYKDELFHLHAGKLVKLDKPIDAQASPFREWLLVKLRSDWTVADRTYKAGSLLAGRFDAYLAGDRKLDVLFEPTDTRTLTGYSHTQYCLLLNILDMVVSRVEIVAHRDGRWQSQPMSGAPTFGVVKAFGVDANDSDDYFVTASDFLTPGSLLLGGVGRTDLERLKQLPAYFKTDGLEVTQQIAKSKDGTQVPYFLVRKQGIERNGQNPTLLYGYGGFEISMLPNYSGTIGAGWLERGGVYALANIRGGGEFGPRWHQAALKENRQRAYDDFIGVAEDLIARKITTSARLGIMGGSNGGLLMGNMLVQRPNLFGAIVCQVPLLDMQRYTQLLAGASWVAEYGDPADPQQWAYLQRYSPYHHVKPGVKYPKIIFLTSTRDDRVHPGHARKMAAKLLEQGQDVLFYENIEGGHGGAADNKQAAFMSSLAYTFLAQQLGLLQD